FGISYYTQGQNLGALLDLSIRHDTVGARGLDDGMLALYNDFYQKGKGFTTEDMISAVNRLSGKDYHDFYRRYVSGVEVPAYDTVFGYGGFQRQKAPGKGPHPRNNNKKSPEGAPNQRGALGSPAERAAPAPRAPVVTNHRAGAGPGSVF